MNSLLQLTSSVAPPSSCVAGCSACCVDRVGRQQWVEVLWSDDRVPEQMTWRDEQGVQWMRHRLDGTCAALERGQCTIYADRPAECRQFEPGDSKCVSARSAMADTRG